MRNILAAAVAAAVATTAFAINTSVFRDAPITRLSQDELEEFKAFVHRILDDAPDGKTVEWRAPRTRFVSKVTPHNSFTENGNRCRETTVESDSNDRYQRGRYLFCKLGGKSWEFALPKARPLNRK